MIFNDREVIVKLDKVLEQQTQHTIQLARNSDILNDHHVRASNLESRMKPVESHVLIVNSIVKIAVTLAGIGGFGAGFIHFFIR